MTKKWRYTLIAVAVIGCAVLAAAWLGTNFRRVLMLTTADPDALGLVQSNSMQPVTLTLETNRLGDIPRAPAQPTSRRHISFKVPAAYLKLVDLKDGAGGSQRVAFQVWSRTFDPVAPDVIADLSECPVGGPCKSGAESRSGRREQSGETPLSVCPRTY